MTIHFRGKKLKELRKSQGITASDLAAKMGYSQSYISRFETDRATPDINALGDMLQMLGSDLPSFFSNELSPDKRKLLDVISKLSKQQIGFLTEFLNSLDLPPYNEIEK